MLDANESEVGMGFPTKHSDLNVYVYDGCHDGAFRHSLPDGNEG